MKAHVLSGGRYPVLSSLGILSVICAGLVAVAGVVGAVWGLFTVTDTLGGKVIWFAAWMAGAFIGCVWMLAFAEMIKLFIDLEHNTRVGNSGNGVIGDAAQIPGVSHVSRIAALDEETAEAALLRGH